MPKLPYKRDMQELFCREYVKDEKFNATQAAIRAGYSPKSAQMQGSRLLSKAMVQRRIAELMQARNKRMDVDADYVLARLIEIDELDVSDILEDDMLDFKPINKWPKAWRTSISGIDLMTIANKGDESFESIVKKIKWPDKTKVLELIGKHVDVSAFAENHTIRAIGELTPWSDVNASSDELNDQDD